MSTPTAEQEQSKSISPTASPDVAKKEGRIAEAVAVAQKQCQRKSNIQAGEKMLQLQHLNIFSSSSSHRAFSEEANQAGSKAAAASSSISHDLAMSRN
jgi:hypothetical protein